jgi:hypothetical protein
VLSFLSIKDKEEGGHFCQLLQTIIRAHRINKGHFGKFSKWFLKKDKINDEPQLKKTGKGCCSIIVFGT